MQYCEYMSCMDWLRMKIWWINETGPKMEMQWKNTVKYTKTKTVGQNRKNANKNLNIE